MRASAFLFAHDLLDETVGVVLDRLERAALQGATLAAAYHHSRDVFPHNPRRKVAYLEGGTVYFHPELDRYGALRPVLAAVARATDPLATLVEHAQQRRMKVGAWTVMLHNTRLASLHPECAPQTAFGDRLINSLCPAHPAVREFATALAGDIARYAVDSIQLEALSYMPFDHGYHHERSFIPLSPNVRFLLGLCFCAHCRAHVTQRGVDAERVRRHVIDLIAPLFESATNETHESEVQGERLRAECAGELGRFLDARQQIVTSLAGDVTRAVHRDAPQTRVIFLDLSGASLGYTTGRPTTEQPAVDIAWRDGLDLPALAHACDGVGMLGYFADPARLEREVQAYKRLIPAGRELEVILRPMAPDSAGASDLAAKIAVLRSAGIEEIAFYHYGFMRLESLEWIAQAL